MICIVHEENMPVHQQKEIFHAILQETIKLELSLTSYTKINARWIKDLNIKMEPSVREKEKMGKYLLS